jgi:hypothetical protein
VFPENALSCRRSGTVLPGVYDASARVIQAWQQDWPRKLAHSTRQRGGQLTWDQLLGSYLKESWSLVR